MQIYCGVDFGTTNTVVTITNKEGKIIDSFSIPTILFLSQKLHGISKVYIGAEAMKKYETGARGRYLHSIKRSLHDKFLKHTIINNEKVTLAELVRYFVDELNKIISHKWGIIPHNIVLGRPVIFSPCKEDDDLAQSRLLEGFRLAGYKKILLLEEPVAASLCFDSHLDKNDICFLIVDLGGGTSDFSIVSRDLHKTGIDRYKVLGTHGINIGGDNFDEDLMYAKLSEPLGSKSTFDSFDKQLSMPLHLYRNISRWNSIHSFDIRKINDDFRDYQYKASNREAVLKLKTVLVNNLSNKLLHKVRESKHDLSEKQISTILYDEHGLDISEDISRNDFNYIIDKRTKSISENINKILIKTNMNVDIIDKVILTGGSSQINYIQKIIGEVFSKDKIIIDNNLHDSVSRGLSSYAYYKGITIF